MDSVGGNIHVLQAALSAYSLFHAYNSITKFQSWEPAAEKAAEVSQVAADELQKTRSSQTSGALAIVGSLLAAFFAIAYPPENSTVRLGFNLAIATICLLGRTHISSYLKGHSKKVPMAQAYNDAVNSTVELRGQLGILSLAWFMTAVLEAQEAQSSS